MVSKEQLLQIMPRSTKIEQYYQPLNNAMELFEINNSNRVSMFLANVAHESGELRYNKELSTGEQYDTGEKAIALGNTPEKDGDGQRYKGRGPIQITGKLNYRNAGTAIGVDLLRQPELAEGPEIGCKIAAWFWKTRGLNEIADIGTEDAFRKIVKRINGGYNGYDARKHYWDAAKITL